MNDREPVIDLFTYKGVALIIERKSGVWYENQTGGYACAQDVIEGVLVPLSDEPEIVSPLGDRLFEYFFGEKHGGHCYAGIDEEDARFFETELWRQKQYFPIKVDRSRLALCREAWIYVEITSLDDTGISRGIEHCSGVITWPNSD